MPARTEINNLPLTAHIRYAESTQEEISSDFIRPISPGTQTYSSSLALSCFKQLFDDSPKVGWASFVQPKGNYLELTPKFLSAFRTQAEKKLREFLRENKLSTKDKQAIILLFAFLEKIEELLLYCENKIRGTQKS
jgi:hypothetical protein